MGLDYVNKTVDKSNILCGGMVEVTLSLTASPNITENPTDIVLVLDRSGSMAGEAMDNLKKGANAFIDIIVKATGGTNEIENGSRIGIVSFADSAVQNTGLITSAVDLKNAVNALTAGGSTNHADAFEKAAALLNSQANGNAKVMVMFTDGRTTAGADPSAAAQAAKAQGIVIYCIGLSGEDGVDPAALYLWATPPATKHVLITPNAEDLEDLFETLAENISKPGATNIVIDETLNSDFKILDIMLPEFGSVIKESDTKLKWCIPKLGTTAGQTAVLKFTAEHVAITSGLKKINASITYTDSEHNKPVFPDPVVNVDCGVIYTPDACHEPISVAIGGCEDTAYYDLEDIYTESTGRILRLDMTLKNVCPHRRVALAVMLNEVDEEGNEYKRGMKMFTIPAHDHETCRDIRINCIHFLLPEDISETENHLMCSQRSFAARIMSHYIDYDFECCPAAEEASACLAK